MHVCPQKVQSYKLDRSSNVRASQEATGAIACCARNDHSGGRLARARESERGKHREELQRVLSSACCLSRYMNTCKNFKETDTSIMSAGLA